VESRRSEAYLVGYVSDSFFLQSRKVVKKKTFERSVIEMSKGYISVAEFGRKYNCDYLLINRLINQYKIQPDIKSGNVKLFKEERLKKILEILDNNYSR